MAHISSHFPNSADLFLYLYCSSLPCLQTLDKRRWRHCHANWPAIWRQVHERTFHSSISAMYIFSATRRSDWSVMATLHPRPFLIGGTTGSSNASSITVSWCASFPSPPIYTPAFSPSPRASPTTPGSPPATHDYKWIKVWKRRCSSVRAASSLH